jgi:hypothetical protein
MDEFQAAFQRVIDTLGKFARNLTPHEQLILEMGMRSSHIEEAIAHGESERASSHLRELAKLGKRYALETRGR